MKIRDTMLPVLRPVGGEEELNSIRESIESGWWGKGPKVAEFEKKFAELVGAKYAVAVNSATTGQDLVFKALGIKDCDIINPTISFMTTAVVPSVE
jgi:perosamine synthetase